MKTLIIYDSVFGNTQKLAETMSGIPDAEAVRVTDAKTGDVSGVELLLVGSPTRGFKPTPAVMTWLKALPVDALKGIRAAAFDSRISLDTVKSRALKFMMKRFGYAAPDIEKELIKKGASITAPPEGFCVEQSEGPLKEGEQARAAAWSKTLAEKA